jgi:hypothetical protein
LQFDVAISPEREVLQLSVSSEVPTHLNSDGGEKLRRDEWLISAILREINQLERWKSQPSHRMVMVEAPAFRPALRRESRRGFSNLTPDFFITKDLCAPSQISNPPCAMMEI